MAERLCRACGGWHDLGAPWPAECASHFGTDFGDGRSKTLATPLLIRDAMDPVQSMLDGKMYDSKSALRATYKAAGVVEVGNDPARLKTRPKLKTDRRKIKESVEKATARVNRGDVSERLKHKL